MYSEELDWFSYLYFPIQSHFSLHTELFSCSLSDLYLFYQNSTAGIDFISCILVKLYSSSSFGFSVFIDHFFKQLLVRIHRGKARREKIDSQLQLSPSSKLELIRVTRSAQSYLKISSYRVLDSSGASQVRNRNVVLQYRISFWDLMIWSLLGFNQSRDE